MKGLDDYIMGIHIRGEGSVKHTCGKCGHIWTAEMTFDMGGWFYRNDDDSVCPKCGNYEDGTIKLD